MIVIFLDLETTGFDPKSDKIIEFAAVRTDENFKEHATLEFLVNPQKAIPDIVQQVTCIFPADIENEKPFEERIEEVKAFIGDDVIVGHNIGFDISFLQEYGIALENKFLDTCDLATIALPKQKSYALEVLSDEFQIEHKYKHRALGDVLACIDLMKILAEHLQFLPESFFRKLEESKARCAGFLPEFLLQEKNKSSFVFQHKVASEIVQETFIETSVFPSQKILFSSLQEAKNSIGSVLKNNGIAVVPKNALDFFLPITNAVNAEILLPSSKYIDEEKLHIFLEKQNFSENETLVFLKILRNLSSQKPLTEDDLNIHWGDFPIWRDVLSTKERKDFLLPENSGILMSYESFFEFKNILPFDDFLFFFEPREDVVDKATTQTVYEQSFLESQKNKNFADAMADFFEEIRNWAGEENEELPYYGKQKLLKIEDFYSESFVYLQKKYFAIQTQFEVQNAFFESFFTKTLGTAKQVNMNGKGKLSFVQTPESYAEIFAKFENISCGAFSFHALNFPFLMGEKFEQLHAENMERKKRPILFPSANFPGPKNNAYTQAIKDELTDVFQNHAERILVVCGSKSQTEELFLHFAVNHELSSSRCFVAAGLSGGKHKMLHYAKKEQNAVVFVQVDGVEAFAQESINFEVMVITKLPFDPPTPLAMFRQEQLKNGFNDYVIPKTLQKLERMIRLTPTHSLHFLDASIQTNWAGSVKTLLQNYAE